MTYAFISYSRDDAADPYLRTFFGDLKRELAARARISPYDVFVDIEQQSGSMWPYTTMEAVRTCGVFIPIYSPYFFNSPYCGREWHVFTSRLPVGDLRAARPIVPVWWVPLLEEPPPAVRDIQDTRGQFGPEYQQYGLRFLLQLKENDGHYRRFLVRFTEMVMTAARTVVPPGTGVNLRDVPDAFAVGAPLAGGPTVRRSGGLRRVTFVVAAAGLQDMSAVRDAAAADIYGEDWEDWRPYYPPCPETIVFRAQGVAYAQRTVSGTTQVTDKFFDLLDAAEARREVVVLIVDPWVVGLTAYRDILRRLDRRRSRNTAILVPWEQLAIRESSAGQLVHDQLHLILENWADSGEQLYRDDILSIEEFEQALAKVILEVKRRIVLRADRARRVADRGPVSPPQLTGPGG